MTRSVLFFAACLGLGACAYTSAGPFATSDELPPPSQRVAVGLWDLGDQNCKGSIHAVAGKPYWVIDCRIKGGWGHCTHGLPLTRQLANQYATTNGRTVFTLAEGGDLEETRDGKLVKSYPPLDGNICGVVPAR